MSMKQQAEDAIRESLVRTAKPFIEKVLKEIEKETGVRLQVDIHVTIKEVISQ